jgi:hypothetical protein
VKLQLLPWFSSKNPNFQHLLTLLGGAVLGLAPTMAHGQSVAFAGVHSIVVSNADSLSIPDSVAVDAAGNLFVHNSYPAGMVYEFPKTATGYGPGKWVFSCGYYSNEFDFSQITVDSAEDVFIGDCLSYGPNPIFNGVEVPWT